MYWILMAAMFLAVSFYTYFFMKRILEFYRADTGKRVWVILRLLISALAGFFCINIWSTGAMLILHLIAVSAVMDIAALAGRKLFANRSADKASSICKKLYGCGLVPFIITSMMLGYGFVNMKHVVTTEYSLSTDKTTEDYRIVLITDTHYGTIQDTDILAEEIQKINEQNPDIVVLGGDIVEEGTSKASMQEAFRVLGGLRSRFGIFYVYGNHDRQPYTDKRSYTDDELENAILANGITILEDDHVEIRDDLVIAGRGDAAWGNSSGRASTEKILEGVDRDKYIILADHQPIGVDENAAQGVDLGLSGHTHGGQIWPVGVLSELAGILNYGKYQIGDSNVIVSSGFTGWGYPIRTEKNCEYVVIDLKSNN